MGRQAQQQQEDKILLEKSREIFYQVPIASTNTAPTSIYFAAKLLVPPCAATGAISSRRACRLFTQQVQVDVEPRYHIVSGGGH